MASKLWRPSRNGSCSTCLGTLWGDRARSFSSWRGRRVLEKRGSLVICSGRIKPASSIARACNSHTWRGTTPRGTRRSCWTSRRRNWWVGAKSSCRPAWTGVSCTRARRNGIRDGIACSTSRSSSALMIGRRQLSRSIGNFGHGSKRIQSTFKSRTTFT